MIDLKGKGACGGIAVGRTVFFKRTEPSAQRRETEDAEGEISRFHSARDTAAAELKELYNKAFLEVGESGAQIFEIHEMMLYDADLTDFIEESIRGERVCAEYAVFLASEHFSKVFSSMNDPYMSARAADIRDISGRLCRILSGESEMLLLGEGVILCADDLVPGDAMRLDKSKISAFVTSRGSVNSHTAILARSMGIPAVVGVGDSLLRLSEGGVMAVDGFEGDVYYEPDGRTLEGLLAKGAAEARAKERLEKYRGLDNVTRDGRRIELFANVQSISELELAIENDAGGIGLFRSEFLYIGRDLPPSEEEQTRIYENALSSMKGKRVIIRTLDAGADKQVPFLGLSHEENPALGMRGIRICLCDVGIFKTQLRALFRASRAGRLSIMFPMISSVCEVSEALTLCSRVREELILEGVSIADGIEIGIMIETPAAALISDRLAPLVDFFSVGTNDLGQYTLAIDRQNRSAARFFDPHHEAILKLIRLSAENAHRHGKWIGICGELGADPALTETFLEMGIDELSVSPPCILPLRERIRETDLGRREEHGN